MEDKCASLSQTRVINGKTLHRNAVPRYRMNIDCPGRLALRFDDQLAASRHRNLHAVKQRRTEVIFRAYRIDRIKSKRADDKPGRHLPAIFIPR